jgi:hypothetical protein
MKLERHQFRFLTTEKEKNPNRGEDQQLPPMAAAG